MKDKIGTDWGTFYLATPQDDGVSSQMAYANDTRFHFIQKGYCPSACVTLETIGWQVDD